MTGCVTIDSPHVLSPGIPEPKAPRAPAAAQQPTAGRKQPAGRAPSEERPAKKLRVDAPEFKPGTQQPRKQEGGSTAAGGSAAAGSSRGRQPIKPPPAGGSRAPAASSSNPPPPKQPQQQQRREEGSVGSRAAGNASAAGEAAGRDRDRGDDKRKPAAGEGGGGNKRARVEQASSDMEPGEVPAPGEGLVIGGLGALLGAAGWPNTFSPCVAMVNLHCLSSQGFVHTAGSGDGSLSFSSPSCCAAAQRLSSST
jgi:hypothetical protein